MKPDEFILIAKINTKTNFIGPLISRFPIGIIRVWFLAVLFPNNKIYIVA